ncbi:MAG: hypothetical protein IJS57_00585 [Paludibacteraceae bacterium]|nr:hypothetical protein [Paludibacteraceae bacterium]
MNKQFFLLLFAIIVSTSAVNSQNVQTYQGTQTFNSMIGAISGNEKYSYFVNEEGQKLRQGTYSFSGSKELSNNTNQLNGNYTLNATFANDQLNGTYSVSAVINGKTWSYARGWQSFSGSSKLTGVFSNGKPNGTFSASYNGDMRYSGSTTLKNGKYIGTYKYSGPGEDNSLWNISGQLTTDGKLIGNWKVENIVADWHKSYTFLNDILIADGQMTPDVQNIAKQFAEGKISEENLAKKGYAIATNEIPLNLFIDYLLLNNDDDFGLDKLGGYNFGEYSSKIYRKVVLANILTDEGFDLMCEAFRKVENPSEESNYNYETRDGLYGFRCSESFAQKYGTHPEMVGKFGWPECIFLTNKQYGRFNDLRDSIAIAKCSEEIIPGLSKYKNDKKNADNTVTYLEAIRGNHLSFTEDDKQLYKKIDYYLNERSKANSEAYSYRFSSDSSYLFKVHFSGKVSSAIRMDLEGVNEYYTWRKQQYERASFCDQEREKIRQRVGDPRNYKNFSFDFAKADIIRTYLSNETPDGYGRNIQLSEYEKIIKETTQVLDICDSLTIKRKMLEEGLPKEAYAAYQKQEETFTDCYPEGVTPISYEQFIENMTKLKEIQSYFLECMNHLLIARKLNLTIIEKCSQAYPDILKIWSKKYKKCATLSDDINTSLADIKEIQNIGQELINYIDLRQHCDSAYTELLDLCGKQYIDVSKPYQEKAKGLNFVPDMTSLETFEKDMATLTEYSSYQGELMQYIQNRQKVEQLNLSITEKIGKAKNLKKLYGVFYKSLPIVWSAEEDNFRNIEEIVAQLQKVDSKLQVERVDAFEPQLKKAKTVEDFEKVFEL